MWPRNVAWPRAVARLFVGIWGHAHVRAQTGTVPLFGAFGLRRGGGGRADAPDLLESGGPPAVAGNV